MELGEAGWRAACDQSGFDREQGTRGSTRQATNFGSHVPTGLSCRGPAAPADSFPRAPATALCAASTPGTLCRVLEPAAEPPSATPSLTVRFESTQTLARQLPRLTYSFCYLGGAIRSTMQRARLLSAGMVSLLGGSSSSLAPLSGLTVAAQRWFSAQPNPVEGDGPVRGPRASVTSWRPDPPPPHFLGRFTGHKRGVAPHACRTPCIPSGPAIW
jgi:hypothetical protein